MIDLAHLELSLEASSRKQSGGFIAQTHCGSPNMAGHANGSRHADGAVDEFGRPLRRETFVSPRRDETSAERREDERRRDDRDSRSDQHQHARAQKRRRSRSRSLDDRDDDDDRKVARRDDADAFLNALGDVPDPPPPPAGGGGGGSKTSSTRWEVPPPPLDGKKIFSQNVPPPPPPDGTRKQNVPPPPPSGIEPPPPPPPFGDDDDADADMAVMMGFGGFGTTQGKHVDDPNANVSSVRKKTTRRARQYMNREGGFNRPLPEEKTGIRQLGN